MINTKMQLHYRLIKACANVWNRSRETRKTFPLPRYTSLMLTYDFTNDTNTHLSKHNNKLQLVDFVKSIYKPDYWIEAQINKSFTVGNSLSSPSH